MWARGRSRSTSRSGRGMAQLLVWLRAIAALFWALLEWWRPLSRLRLMVRTKGVDRTLLASTRGSLRAFVDGSVTGDGKCGFGIFYGERHPLNVQGGFDAGAAPAQSNLTELAALYWVLRHHPRGQHLSVFSDSAHVLRVVQAESSVDEREGGSSQKRKRRGRDQDHSLADKPPACPKLDPREASLARAIGWLLRLRTAQTCLYKVPAHKGFTQNTLADALARTGAEKGPVCQLPLTLSFVSLVGLLLSYLVGQSELDGGAGGNGVAAHEKAGGAVRGKNRNVRRPEALGTSTELTHVLALDCEMVGVSLWGGDSRLASVSVVNEFGVQVYFSYAKPARRVIDYRTRYSGIKPHMLVDAPPAAKVQAEVRALVEGHVVAGHSLENDFRALGFFPPRAMLRDTAHDVPRLLSGAGRPRKLRHITWEFLGLTIQDRGEDGHDPCEDARAALLLYLRFREEFEAVAVRHAAESKAKQEAKLRLAEEQAAERAVEPGEAKVKVM